MGTDESHGRGGPVSPRDLPPVNEVLGHAELAATRAGRGREATLRAVRAAIDEARTRLRQGLETSVDAAGLARRARMILEGESRLLRSVINATGILLHTGLGRAPLAEEALAAVVEASRGYSNLELDLGTGDRGKRTSGISQLLRELAGAEAATVVNNNAGATVLALRALASGREVIVSRGQLVEIGGSFRLPEIFEVSGARLREVGTTNKTRIGDYERAITPETAAILRVHPSNYRIVGFTEEAPLGDLAGLARARGLWMIDDIGSGSLAPGFPPGIEGEPTVAEGIASGADIVLFSGDKLLGGPQCGLMVGRKDAIARVEADPLMRALRVDKMTLAALEATLRLLRDGREAAARLPLWRMLTTPLEELRSRAGQLARAFRDDCGLDATVVDTESFLGGGSVPVRPIPTVAVRVGPPFPPGHGGESAWARALRGGPEPVVARVQGGALLFDLRTIAPREDPILLDSVRRSCHDQGCDILPGGRVAGP